MIEEKLHALPGHLIRRAYQHALNIFSERTKDLNLTPIQHAILTVIDEFPSIDASRIGEIISIDRATIGNVIQRLEDRALLVRTPDIADARVKNLFLSTAGREIVETMNGRLGEIRVATLVGLTPEEQNELMRLLAKLVDIEEVKNSTADYRRAVNQFRTSVKSLAKGKR